MTPIACTFCGSFDHSEGACLVQRVQRRMNQDGIPIGTDDPGLLALGAAPMTDPSPVVGGHGPHDDQFGECCGGTIHAGGRCDACGSIYEPRPHDDQPRMMTGIWPKKIGEDTVAMEDVYDPAHDDQPHWTVSPKPDDARYFDIEWHGHKLWAEANDALPKWLAYDAWDDLVRAVRDAAEVPALRTHATTLAEIRDLSAGITRWIDHGRFTIALVPTPLLDLLTGETDGE